jgi:hypothetical protein
MKKLLLFAFVFSSLLASAQQESFEFFKKSEVNLPFTQTGNIPPTNIDSKGRTWSVKGESSEIRLYNNTDTNTVRIDTANILHKKGYSYYPSGVEIDETNTKLVLLRGYLYLNSKSYYDDYLIRQDSSGKITISNLKDLGLSDSSVYINNFRSIGGKAIFFTNTGRYIMEADVNRNITGPNFLTLISDKKGTLYQEFSLKITFQNL